MRIPIPFWATLCTICGVFILCCLGMWQVQRLAWKQDLIQSIAREYAPDASLPFFHVAGIETYTNFKRGFLQGTFLHDKSINIQGRTHDGVPGYHVLTPFVMADNNDAVIIVNRGWVPLERERDDDFVMTLPDGDMTLTGTLRLVPRYNFFVPQNMPDKDEWYRIKPDDIARHYALGGIVKTHLFYVEHDHGHNASELHSLPYPVPVLTHKQPSNNHAQYAFFWFAMACALIGVYVFRFIVPLYSSSARAVDEKG